MTDERDLWGMKETSGVVCPHLWKKIVKRDSVDVAINTNHPIQTTPEVDWLRV